MHGDAQDEGLRYTPVLLEYRVTQIEKRMEKLATADQVQELKQAFEESKRRGFTFWVMVVGGPSLAGIIVALATAAVAHIK